MKIELIGDIHPELQTLGLKAGDIISDAEKSKTTDAMYFTIYYNGFKMDCVVWSDNYKIVEEKLKLKSDEKS